MNERELSIAEENAHEWEKISFVLNQRKKPTVVWISCDTDIKKKEVFEAFKARFSVSFQHFTLNLSLWKEGSFTGFLKENIPEEILHSVPGTWMVHLEHLESQLIKGNEDAVPPIVQVINFERELIFRSFPFFIVFWTNSFSSAAFQRSAHDFWDWVSNRFEFHSEPYLLKEAVKPDLQLKIQDPARSYRIARLRADRNRILAADEPNADELLTLNEQLAREYYLLPDPERAIRFFREAIQQTDADTPEQKNRKALLLRELGEVYSDIGNADQALDCFQQSINLFRLLIEANPSSETLQREISISLDNLGDLFREEEQIESARQHFAESLEIAKKLAAANPGSETLQRDVSISLDNLGDLLYREAGQTDAARQYFTESIEIVKKLIASDPSSEMLQRDLYIAYERFGDLDLESDRKSAKKFYNRAFALAKKLLDEGSSSLTILDDIARYHNRIGDVCRDEKKISDARFHFEKSREIRRKILSANPDSKKSNLLLRISIDKLGNLYKSIGMSKEAQKCDEEISKLKKSTLRNSDQS